MAYIYIVAAVSTSREPRFNVAIRRPSFAMTKNRATYSQALRDPPIHSTPRRNLQFQLARDPSTVPTDNCISQKFMPSRGCLPRKYPNRSFVRPTYLHKRQMLTSFELSQQLARPTLLFMQLFHPLAYSFTLLRVITRHDYCEINARYLKKETSYSYKCTCPSFLYFDL